MRGTEWYPRLAAVPGVRYSSNPSVDRSRLPHVNLRPVVNRYRSLSDDEVSDSLSWRYSETEWSSQSPASAHASMLTGDYETWVRVTQEALECPGTPSDYHFIMQSCVDTLWLRHRRQPGALSVFEMFARADVSLVSAHRAWFTYTTSEDAVPGYFRIATIDRLAAMLSREGAWRDALEVAEIAVSLGQGQKRRDEIAERVALLDAETEA